MSGSPVLRNQLYFGDLPKTVDEEFLLKLVSSINNIQPTNIVIKDAKFGENKYAFLTFSSQDEAKEILSELNYTKLDGIPIRISYSDRETHRIMRTGNGNLFIKNLDKQIEVSQLHEAFGSFGEIISCKIPLTNGASRGYGFVQFREVADAEKAMLDLKDASIYGKTISIEKYIRKQPKNPEDTFTNVYIKDIPKSIDSEEKFRQLCVKFGPIVSAKLQTKVNPDTGAVEFVGFGFCNFQRHEDAKACVQELNGKKLNITDEKPLYVQRQQNRQERQNFLDRNSRIFKNQQYEKTKGRNLYVRGFNEEYTEDDLQKYFEEYGEIESKKVMREPKDPSVSRKFGFVCFKNKEDAEKAIRDTTVREDSLYVALAQSREVRTRTLAMQQQSMTKSQINMPNTTQMYNFIGDNATPRHRLIREVNELSGGESLAKEIKNLSEEQVKALNDDPNLFQKWISRKTK